jgi:2-polyprenyl-3-methyl-5-hydroxy-6-metoxy-1,4-benzoquinol methylase
MVERVAGAGAELLNVSAYSSDCRVYRRGEAVFKIRRQTPSSTRGRLNSLEDEYLILQRLSGLGCVPAVRRYERIGQWEVIEMAPLPSLRGFDPTFGEPREPLDDFLSTVRITRRINRLGCSHGDLHVRNAGRNSEGGLSFFDFDQAQVGHPLRCALRDFFGLSAGLGACRYSLLERAYGVQGWGLVFRAAHRIKRAFLRVASRLYRHKAPQRASFTVRQRAALLGDAALTSLAEAWEFAAASDASSPGVNLAYYSLDISGVNFPGERPWLLRWDRIRRHVDFRGKRMLELGCNLGLLSIHARLHGAVACTGLDVDARILRAADVAAKAFGVDVRFQRQDLDSADRWEADLRGFDIVSALSVLHWVRDKRRAWAFLGAFPEVLYEGHESQAEAEAALRNAGFDQIVRLGPTERNRQMYLARRVPV